MENEVSLTQISLKSAKKGPTIWFTGVVHGDEKGGRLVIENAFKKIKKYGLFKGNLYAFPLINKEGFKKNSRLIPKTKEDINRCFPGSKTGTLGKRIAYEISKKIMETNPSLVIDLHNDWKNSILYVVIDPIKNKKLKNIVEKIAKNTGIFCLREKNIEYRYESSLSGHFISKGIPSFTLELGGRLNNKNIKLGENIIFQILSYLGMIKKKKNYLYNKKLKNAIFDYFEEPKIHKKGKIKFFVRPGEFVKKGKKIMEIYNERDKKELYIFKARKSGVVLGYQDNNIAVPGTSAIAFGVNG